MELTIGISNNGKSFYICDYISGSKLNLSDLVYLLEMDRSDIEDKIFDEFNGDQIYSSDFFFYELSHVKKALEWIEPIMIANLLAHPENNNFLRKDEINLSDLLKLII